MPIQRTRMMLTAVSMVVLGAMEVYVPSVADTADATKIVVKEFMFNPTPLTVKAGTTEEWIVENWTNELHAFHIHQVHFRLLEIDGQRADNPPLLDVVNVPYATATGYHSKEGPIRPGRVRIKLTFPPALAGDIPFHCHLADHEDNGMMAVLRVVPVRRAAAPAE